MRPMSMSGAESAQRDTRPTWAGVSHLTSLWRKRGLTLDSNPLPFYLIRGNEPRPSAEITTRLLLITPHARGFQQRVIVFTHQHPHDVSQRNAFHYPPTCKRAKVRGCVITTATCWSDLTTTLYTRFWKKKIVFIWNCLINYPNSFLYFIVWSFSFFSSKFLRYRGDVNAALRNE